MAKNISESFTWPEFASESKRVKAWSARYKDKTVSEAFQDMYPGEFKNIAYEKQATVNLTPVQAKAGDVLPVTIKSVTKEGVVLDCTNQKDMITTKTNLWKYKRFRDGDIPSNELQAVVLDRKKNILNVDILSPIFHKWLDPILKTPQVQKPTIYKPQPTWVRDLKLVNGGFVGKARIPSLSDFLGEDYEVDAFIPGSHIVLNIAKDFTEFEGASVPTFILNYIPKNINGVQKMSLVCSRKEYLRYMGDLNMIDMYGDFCDDGEMWKKDKEKVWCGSVTGIIHSSSKCGVFIEVPDLLITGLVALSPDELVNYKAGDAVKVSIHGFEIEKKYNAFVDQYQQLPVYKLDDSGNIIYSNFKPNLVLVK